MLVIRSQLGENVETEREEECVRLVCTYSNKNEAPSGLDKNAVVKKKT